MQRILRTLAFSVVASSQLVQAVGGQQEEVLTNADIIALTEAGVSSAIIVSKIEDTGTDFDLSVDGLVSLSKAGVGESVMAAMTRAVASRLPVGDGGASGAGEPPASLPPGAPSESFSDMLSSGGRGPEMVVIPAGRFQMGCVSGVWCYKDEKPAHEVAIERPFAVSKYEVTFEDYDRFTSAAQRVRDQGWGRGRLPVINVSWEDAQAYVAWLSRETGANYRLLTEAEWEYVARAGTRTAFSWGNEVGTNNANCRGCGSPWDSSQTAPAGSFAPNAWGVHDMSGNVWEWVQDCWNRDYNNAPSDGSAWLDGRCSRRVFRGGSWQDGARGVRSAFRVGSATGFRSKDLGFRVARMLAP